MCNWKNGLAPLNTSRPAWSSHAFGRVDPTNDEFFNRFLLDANFAIPYFALIGDLLSTHLTVLPTFESPVSDVQYLSMKL